MKPIQQNTQQRQDAATANGTKANGANANGNDPEFDSLVDELVTLMQEGRLPEGFDLQEAASDPELAKLMREFGAEAGIRIYAAEQRAEQAENKAMERVSARVRDRNSLPKSTRNGSAAPAQSNYGGMSSEAFRSLMQQMKKTSRDGGKTRL